MGLVYEAFDTLLEAKVLIERWRVLYNTVRPHSSLGYRPPPNVESGYHEIKVTVDREGVSVRTRPGYYLPPPPAD